MPKPHLNNRSAKSLRNNPIVRTTSAEYTDNMTDGYDVYGVRQGAMSAPYNEDYNYAYQSIDNLPAQPEEVDITPVSSMTSDNRTSINANVVNGTDQYNQDYFYNTAQSEVDYEDRNYFDVPQTKNGTGKRDSSLLMQQTTDSLESKDDEYKDSYDTAVSSVNSSLHQLKSTPYSEYSTAAEMIITNTTPTVVQPIESHQQVNSVTTSQYYGDQQQNKAIVTNSLPSVTVAQVHNNHTNYVNNKASTKGYLKAQESIEQPRRGLSATVSVDQTYYDIEEENYPEQYNHYDDHADPYLEPQESVETYVEEESDVPNGIDYTNKAINHDQNHDSPSSVIHVENYDDTHSLRRGSSQITVVDPYHPSLQRSLVQPGSRRASATDPFPTRRTSGDAFQSFDDPYAIPPSRKQSLVDAVGNQRRASLRHSPTPPEHEDIPEEERADIVDDDVPEKKSVSFEEEEEAKQQRPQVTAQQRWLWAYNKIIMQLNVCLLLYKNFLF